MKNETERQPEETVEAVEVETAEAPEETDLEKLIRSESRISTELDRQERSLLDRVSSMEDAAKIFDRRAQILSACRMAAIRETNPHDWVLFVDRDGNANAMPKKSGCDKIADIYGIELYDIKPRNAMDVFTPEKVTSPQGAVGYRGWASALSRATGRRIEVIEASRFESEDFIGRKLGNRGAPDVGDSDIRNSVLTLLHSKAARIIAGLSSVPASVLEQAWQGTGKSFQNASRGHGYGTAAERTATSVAEEGVEEARAKLRSDILSAVGGDVSAARDLLKEITANPDKGFGGFSDIGRLTKLWQVEKAQKELAAHPVFGGK